MKKLLALALAAAMMFSMVACGGNNDDGGEVEATYKLGLGMTTTLGDIEDASEEGDGTFQINTTIAVLVIDGEGKVVSAKLDVAQQGGAMDTTGALTTEPITLTKVERGDGYGMRGVSEAIGIGKELFEQLEAFEAWMVGKTKDEIVNTETYKKDEEHTDVPTDEDLAAGVTISIGDYLVAIGKAFDNAVETTGPVAKMGLGTTISPSIDEGSVQINTTVAAVAFDEDGKVVAAKLDVAQQSVAWDENGVVTSVPDELGLRTKVEKGDDYGMRGLSESLGIGKELFEQLEGFEDWMLGKTADEIANADTSATNFEGAPTLADTTAGVTISVGDYLLAVAEARATAK